MSMELILCKPIEELIPAMIAWNNTELMQAVQTRLAHYENISYTDDEINSAKEDRASLNKLSKALNDERLRIKKAYDAPYLAFKTQVDEVIGRIDTANSAIGTRIRSYEEARDSKKLETINEYFAANIGELNNFIKIENIYDSRWLNTGFTLKKIYEDIDNRLGKIRDDLVAIEALKSEQEAELKSFYLRTLDIGKALQENERLNEDKRKIAEISAKQATNSVPTAALQVEKSVGQTETPQIQIYTLRFECKVTEQQMQALKQCLIQNNIEFIKI